MLWFHPTHNTIFIRTNFIRTRRFKMEQAKNKLRTTPSRNIGQVFKNNEPGTHQFINFGRLLVIFVQNTNLASCMKFLNCPVNVVLDFWISDPRNRHFNSWLRTIFFKNNRRKIHKKKLRTFQARGNENVKNIELQQKNLVLIKNSVVQETNVVAKLQEIYYS